MYAAQLENITVQLKMQQPQAKLVFAMTTPFMCTAQQDGCVVNLNNQVNRVSLRLGSRHVPSLTSRTSRQQVLHHMVMAVCHYVGCRKLWVAATSNLHTNAAHAVNHVHI